MPILCLIALGCPKNIVECESIAGRLQAAGLRLTTDLNCADYALVHTCSFIGDARGESVATIRRLLRLKKAGRLERVFVSGCFVQAEGTAVCGMFPEVDGWIGTGDLERITELLAPGSRYIETPPGGMLESPFPRLLSSTLPSTYVRLAEGCNHRCSFCIIPRLRGKYKSRSMNAIAPSLASS
jgi:ribosomal protein S12 methylthiotransferase